MVELDLRFSDTAVADTGTYKLLELPSDLCKLLESSPNGDALNLVIKGQPNEDAVLCTETKTWALRSVVLSNSMLVVTPPTDSMNASERDVVIRDQIHDVLELVPTLPRLQKLGGLLRGREYDEGHSDEEMDVDDAGDRPTKKRKFTYDDAEDMLQASSTELARGLRDRRVLTIQDELRPIAPSHLTTILELLLNYLVSLSQPHHAADVENLAAALEDDHEVKRDVSRQVMGWFGEVKGGKWAMDVNATVKEVGVGILRAYKDDPIEEPLFIQKWKTTVGDTFQEVVDMSLLSGYYLSNPSPYTDPPIHLLTYFPISSLPPDPTARFTDLFLTRSRWKAEDIAPFLADIVLDHKERDKMLMKYARATTDPDGVWYTARAKYTG